MSLSVESSQLAMPSLRCAPFHASMGADPGGTAGAYEGFLMVEIPLPWGHDISASEPFASLMGGVAPFVSGPDGRRWRPQGLVPRNSPGQLESLDGVVVLAFDRPLGVAGPYRRRKWTCEPTAVESLCAAIVAGSAEGEIESVAGATVAASDSGLPSELFICTHGRRDTCCGGLGTPVFDVVQQRLAEALPGSVDAVWRTSHTGGHKFAPTALSFPDGYAWAHLDADLAERIARRSVPPTEVAAHCRGSAAFDLPPAQVADREGLVAFGWDWANAERKAQVVAHERDTLRTVVAVSAQLNGEVLGSVHVAVDLDRHIPQPTCGRIDEPEFATSPVWKVAELTVNR